jgi:hypothetical protein
MQTSPQQPMQRAKRIQAAAIGATLTLLLGACGTNGDFGEVRPSLVRDDIHDWIGRDVTGSVPSNFELTDDERQMRDLAYPLIEPPFDRNRWYSVAGEYGVGTYTPFDRTVYATRLFTVRDRSPAARYAQLIDDIRNDTTRMPQFFETAARVLDVDRKRDKALNYVSGLSPYERDNARRRVRENIAILHSVQASLDQRASSYRFAMERIVVMTPSPQAIEVERALNEMRATIAQYRAGAPLGRTTGSLAMQR